MGGFLGFDIGGANTKAVFLRTQKGTLQGSSVAVEYFPVWKDPDKLIRVLLGIKKRLRADKLDGLGVTMTAELSDAYTTKRKGVCHILSLRKKSILRRSYLRFEYQCTVGAN